MKYSINQSTEGNKNVQVKNERKLRNLGIESCPNSGKESGSKKIFSLHSDLLTPVVLKILLN